MLPTAISTYCKHGTADCHSQIVTVRLSKTCPTNPDHPSSIFFCIDKNFHNKAHISQSIWTTWNVLTHTLPSWFTQQPTKPATNKRLVLFCVSLFAVFWPGTKKKRPSFGAIEPRPNKNASIFDAPKHECFIGLVEKKITGNPWVLTMNWTGGF